MSKDFKEKIDSQQLSEALSERYLSYAVSTIVSRALPDVRDGLKPVHRRILYSMLRQSCRRMPLFVSALRLLVTCWGTIIRMVILRCMTQW